MSRSAFPFHLTKVCLEPDCGAVFLQDANGRCPACGSSAYWFLSKWLRPVEERPAGSRGQMSEPERQDDTSETVPRNT